MNTLFAETLRKLRMERGLSQEKLGKQMFIDHSTVARWENGSRMPDAMMLHRLARCLGVDANTLFDLAGQSDDVPIVIMVDDDEIVLAHSVTVLEEVLPSVLITGFIWPSEAMEYAKVNRVDLAILDIELGTASGLDLCNKLVEINPCTKVVFLTAYPEYSLDAWKTEASGFMLKPLTPEGVREQVNKLHIRFFAEGQ